MLGTLRAVSESSRKHAMDAMRRLVDGIAGAHEMQATLEFDRGYKVTSNDDDAASLVLRVAEKLLGSDATGRMPTPVMGAEDFSYVLEERPGAMAFLGVCPPGEQPARAHACHSNRMMIDEDALRVGTAMYAAIAEEYLAQVR
jgi:hippurate hydrolase